MPFQEGVGYKAPKPMLIRLDRRETSEVRAHAKLLHKRKGYDETSCFVGWCGEAALGKFIESSIEGIHRTVQLTILPTTDGGIDLIVCGLKIQVKTRYRSKVSYFEHWKGKRAVPLVNDLYVFARLRTAPSNPEQYIDLLGFVYKAELSKLGRQEKKNGVFRLVIDEKYMNPIAPRLTDLIRARRAASGTH